MTDMTPGSRWLLPVTLSKVLSSSGYARLKTDLGVPIILSQNQRESLIPADRITELEAEVARLRAQCEDEHQARLSLQNLAADEIDVSIALLSLLSEARFYVTDALEAYEHTDGRDLLNRIDAALNPAPSEKEAG